LIEINDLTVRFGGVTPLDQMTLTFPHGTNGLIGPNGAGKTTFFNVLSGFIRPAKGSVTAFDDNLLSMPHYRRARWAIKFVGLSANPQAKVGTLGAADRRLVEIARAVVGKPRVVLLDEPAAGLPDEETQRMGEVIQKIPEEVGALVILVDHDMSLVSACCTKTAVLDFGKLIASGDTPDVLRNEQVKQAYLGTEAAA